MALLRQLQKLRLRWWHATKGEMTRALRAANIHQTILDLSRTVVNNWRERRTWMLPEHQAAPTLRRSSRLDQHVECDVMFCWGERILQFVRYAPRWRNGRSIGDRRDSAISAAVGHSWTHSFGAVEVFIVDGEGGLMSQYFHRG